MTKIVVPAEITAIKNHAKRTRARTYWAWGVVKELSGHAQWRDLCVAMGFHPRSISTLRSRGYISGATARRIQNFIGKDAKGKWILPKEMLAPEAFVD